MATDIERAIQQSFTEAYTNNEPISTSETSKVNDIFENIVNTLECIICCDEEKTCVKCFKCTALYCKECLIKIASEFNKCSTCSVEIKGNYNKIKECNIELQEQYQIEKAIADSINEFITSNKKNKNKNNNIIDKKKPNSKNDNIICEKPKYNEKIIKKVNNHLDGDGDGYGNEELENTSLNTSFRPLFKINNNSKKHTDTTRNNNSNNSNNSNTNPNSLINKKKEYLEDLRNNKIYNIDFKTYINSVSSNKPNYSFEWDYINKTLTFYTLCNDKNDCINIVLKYTILDSMFQAELYPWINYILKNSLLVFKNKWNQIAKKINNVTKQNDSNSERIRILKEIIDICKN